MRGGLRPDPSKGVFETMLVLDGRPIELAAHLRRLADSVTELYGGPPPIRTPEIVLEHAAGVEHGKLRVDLAPDGHDRLQIQVAVAEVDPAAVFPGPERPAHLSGVTVEGGLGAHKWADRRLLEGAEARLPPGELPLLLDGDGAVLEVSRASIFRIRDGAIETPPLDGRILPSIARSQALEAARAEGIEAREVHLSLADLLDGEEVFLSGSVRGIEPAGSIDGIEVPAGGALSSRVADALRRRWLGASRAELAAAGGGAPPSGRRGR